MAGEELVEDEQAALAVLASGVEVGAQHGKGTGMVLGLEAATDLLVD